MAKCTYKKATHSAQTKWRNHCTWIKIIKISNNWLAYDEVEETTSSLVFA